MNSLSLKLFRRPTVTFVGVGPGNQVQGEGFPRGELEALNLALQQLLPAESSLRQTFPNTLQRLRAKSQEEPNLAFWLEVDLPAGTSEKEAEAIAERLKGAAPVLELAYVAPKFRAAQSRHLLESGLGGIGAEAAWGIAGGTGGGVSVGLVDNGYEVGHAWLPVLELHGVRGKSWSADHGTWCAGIVLGNPLSGAPGIAYDAAGHLSPIIDGNLKTALDNLLLPSLDPMGTPTGSSLGNGDVIWVPQELVSGEPVEVDPAVRAELKALASGLGIVVVIAAGNGGAQVYDLPVTAEDSEAIVVGAGGSGTVSTAQERNYGNYGARVDCQGWGDHVLAVGVGGLVNGEQTSAACSMVAGIAAVVESVARRCSRGAISPAELRAALRDPNLGIPYQGSDPIGALPDLRRLLDHFGLWPDSFVRDHVGDDGTEPSSPSQMIWASPDIIPRLQVETNPGGTLGGTNWDLDLAESPAAGATCQLYVRLQNRSFVDHDVTVDLYWAYEGAWISPSEWHHIGAINAHSPGRDFTGVLSSPERVVAGPLAWPTPTDTTHPCLIAVLWSTVDLAALPGPMTSDVQYADFVREHNNVTHRNIILGEAIPQALYACAFTACMPRIDGGPPVLRPMPDNLHGARAFLGLGRGQPVRPRGAPALLSLDELAGPEALGIEQGAIRRAFDGDRRLGDRRAIPMPENWTPIHDGGDLVLEGLSPGESVPVVVLLRPPERPRAGSEIRIVQYQGDRPIGALTYRFGQAVLG